MFSSPLFQGGTGGLHHESANSSNPSLGRRGAHCDRTLLETALASARDVDLSHGVRERNGGRGCRLKAYSKVAGGAATGWRRHQATRPLKGRRIIGPCAPWRLCDAYRVEWSGCWSVRGRRPSEADLPMVNVGEPVRLNCPSVFQAAPRYGAEAVQTFAAPGTVTATSEVVGLPSDTIMPGLATACGAF